MFQTTNTIHETIPNINNRPQGHHAGSVDRRITPKLIAILGTTNVNSVAKWATKKGTARQGRSTKGIKKIYLHTHVNLTKAGNQRKYVTVHVIQCLLSYKLIQHLTLLSSLRKLGNSWVNLQLQ